MGSENFDDNNRRNNYEPYLLASYLLDSSKPAIIFTQGDNYTFPLWYAQEVEGKGKSHTIVDYSYLSSPRYVVNLMKQGDRGLHLMAKPEDILYLAYAFTEIPPDPGTPPPSLKDLLKDLYAKKEGNPRFSHSEFVLPGKDSLIFKLKELSGGNKNLEFKKLMLLDIIASNFDNHTGKNLLFLKIIDPSFTAGLDSLLQWAEKGKIMTPWQ